jgi:hypothetical protein
MTTHETIDHATLAHLVEAGTVRTARAIGQAGGWAVVVKHDMIESTLTAQRSRHVRLFKKLETLVGYLKEVGITRFDVDAASYDPATIKTVTRADTSAALKNAHQAAAYDAWFRAQVEQGLTEADDPTTQWVTDEDANAGWAAKRAALLERVRGSSI